MIRATLLLALTACGTLEASPSWDDTAGFAPEADVDAQAARRLRVWQTCGDPVCSGYVPSGDPICPSWVTPGMRCPARLNGRACDPVDFCNSLYVCQRTDPTAGGCPISQRAAKTDIDYLDAGGVDALARELEAMPLATWTYVDGKGEPGEHLGFVIEDVQPSPAVRPSGERVDLYGYTSLAVAALQSQARRIEALEARLEAVEAGECPQP